MQVSMDIPDMLRAKRASEIYSQVGKRMKMLRIMSSNTWSPCVMCISMIDTFLSVLYSKSVHSITKEPLAKVN